MSPTTRSSQNQAKPPRRVFYELGRAYAASGQDGQAATFYQKAADMRHPLAFAALGEFYLNGRGLPRNSVLAISMFARASDGGYFPAALRIGQIYAAGLGIERDYAKAASYFEVAATQLKVTSAYAELGQLYLTGRGVPLDKQKACDLFRQGSEAKDPTAMARLASACGTK